MDWDPRLAMMRAELSHDLERVGAWCRHKHPDTPPHTLVAAAKIYEALGVAMDVSVAEIVRPFDEAPIIETAVEALGAIGHFTSTAGARWTSPGIVVFAADLTAHERIAAVRFFRDLGLAE